MDKAATTVLSGDTVIFADPVRQGTCNIQQKTFQAVAYSEQKSEVVVRGLRKVFQKQCG